MSSTTARPRPPRTTSCSGGASHRRDLLRELPGRPQDLTWTCSLTIRGVNAVLKAAEWVERWVFRILGVLVRGVTAVLAKIMRRGRFRLWRKGA
jgi:hypothetical protein